MLFNSVSFAIFLPVVFFLYWFVANKNLKTQNLLLLAASYFFYACWDWRFLILLMFSTWLDYFTGLKMFNAKAKKGKAFWFWLSIVVNAGFLGFFKYYNFFISSFAEGLDNLGIHTNPWVLQVILPVGISFYTFHGLSYVIDIYKGRIPAEKNFTDYAVFVSFFPLLVAGPIERATHLLPQIKKERTFDYTQAADGMRQILWGLFKKIVIADQCADYANTIFNNPGQYQGSTLLIGALFFTFQIYGDFSGYSDIALGTARLFGISLLRNFAFPYFSRDIAEFWRRWHISLSTWFRDYLYIPLGGSKGSTWIKIRNTFIIFLVSGFWHGANWTFIVWGLLNALYIMPSIIFKTHRNNIDIVARDRRWPTSGEVLSILVTFGLTVFAWIFFRAATVQQAFGIIKKICSKSLLSVPQVNLSEMVIAAFCIFVFMVIEWFGRREQYAIAHLDIKLKKPWRYALYYSIALAVFWFSGGEQQFIYFQF
jgi:alginate O-acetyltransferase complex protein AlgI